MSSFFRVDQERREFEDSLDLSLPVTLVFLVALVIMMEILWKVFMWDNDFLNVS
jgi:hypothetical protein